MDKKEFATYLFKKYRISELRNICTKNQISFKDDDKANEIAKKISHSLTYEEHINPKKSKSKRHLDLRIILPILGIIIAIYLWANPKKFQPIPDDFNIVFRGYIDNKSGIHDRYIKELNLSLIHI